MGRHTMMQRAPKPLLITVSAATSHMCWLISAPVTKSAPALHKLTAVCTGADQAGLPAPRKGLVMECKVLVSLWKWVHMVHSRLCVWLGTVCRDRVQKLDQGLQRLRAARQMQVQVVLGGGGRGLPGCRQLLHPGGFDGGAAARSRCTGAWTAC